MQHANTLLQHLLAHAPLSCLGLLEHSLKFPDLLDAALPRDDCPNRVLNGGLLMPEVLYLLCNHRQVLLRSEPVYAVEEDRAVVVRDQEAVPSLKKLFLEQVAHVPRDIDSLLGASSKNCLF